MSVNSVKWKAIARTFKSVCRRWVNPAIRDEAEAALQSGLFAVLFALPPLALATSAFSVALGNIQSGSLTALSISLPVLAASWLTLTGSQRVRNAIIGALGPMFVLACAASPAAFVAAMSISVIHAFSSAWRRNPGWQFWMLSGAAAFAVGSALLAVWPAPVALHQILPSIPVMLAAPLFFQWSTSPVAIPAAPTSQSPALVQLTALARHTGSALALVEKNGLVVKTDGNSMTGGSAAAKLIGRGLVDRLHVADRPAFLSWIGGLTASESQDTITARLASAEPDAKLEWVKCSFAKIGAEDGRFLLSIITDDADKTSRPEIDAVAVGSLGHELRTPLNAIAGFSEMLRDGFCGPLTNERQKDYVDLIHRSSRHLLQVSNAMLDWSQLESGTRQLTPELFAPADTASLAIRFVAGDAQAKGVSLDFIPACGLDEFRGDERALTQILVNLLSNAVKFAPVNGQVQLALDVDDDRLRISVADNGPGMNANDQARVGVPFFQAPRQDPSMSSGAGLGLSIVRELTRLHGGSLQIDSEPGRGTSVTVALQALRPHWANISELRSAKQDESTRIIRVFEERGHATNRKTA